MVGHYSATNNNNSTMEPCHRSLGARAAAAFSGKKGKLKSIRKKFSEFRKYVVVVGKIKYKHESLCMCVCVCVGD